MAENQFCSTAQSVAAALKNKFHIPNLDTEDLSQYIILYCYEVKDRYNPERGTLYSFLYKRSLNKLKNLVRDKVQRYEPPCRCCNVAAYLRDREIPRAECQTFRDWRLRNQAKANVNSPVGIDEIDPRGENNTYYTVDFEKSILQEEILKLIDTHLPVQHRRDFTLFMDGVKLPVKRENILLNAIRNVAEKNLSTNNW